MSEKKSAMAHVRHEFLSDIVAHISTILVENSIDKARAEAAALDVANHLADHWGGQNFSFPKDYTYKVSERDLAIFNEANRDNIHEVARRNGISVNAVYRALKRIRPMAIARSQPDMFN